MIAYVDSSVLLRKVLRQPGSLKEWRSIQTGVASALVETECLRTLDRLRLRANLPDRDLATALLWGERLGVALVMATHDVALGTAARACGPRVVGDR